MDKDPKSEVDIVVECPNNRNKYKQLNIRAHCHIHYNNDTLHLLNCRTYHKKYIIACTANKNNNTLVDLHWGEHYFLSPTDKTNHVTVYDRLRESQTTNN